MTPGVAVTGLLAMASVSLWTLRVALTARNHKAMAAAAASVEATVFVLAFSRILSSLDSVVQVAAYATGVGCGTLVGLNINDRLGPRTRSRLGRPVMPSVSVAAAAVDDLKACIADWDNLEAFTPRAGRAASSARRRRRSPRGPARPVPGRP
jgi:hypothetical protein